jgi:hypothetical protein
MCKESYAKESEQCPGCGRQFTFVHFHIPSCAAAMARKAEALAKIRRSLPFQTAQVALAATSGPVRDKKFGNLKKKGRSR